MIELILGALVVSFILMCILLAILYCKTWSRVDENRKEINELYKEWWKDS